MNTKTHKGHDWKYFSIDDNCYCKTCDEYFHGSEDSELCKPCNSQNDRSVKKE